jgi:hypothetical protein
MSYKKICFISTLIFSDILFSQAVDAQTITITVQQASPRSSMCELTFEITNHTNSNITRFQPEFLYKRTDGSILDKEWINSERLQPNSTIISEWTVDASCSDIGSIEFGGHSGGIRIDGNSMSDSVSDTLLSGILINSSVAAIKAPSQGIAQAVTSDAQSAGSQSTSEAAELAGRAYLCFSVSHLTLEAYQRAGYISGYSLSTEPVLNRSHPDVSSGTFTDIVRHQVWQSSRFHIEKIYSSDPSFTEEKYKSARDPLINASNDKISQLLISCKNEWLEQM